MCRGMAGDPKEDSRPERLNEFDEQDHRSIEFRSSDRTLKQLYPDTSSRIETKRRYDWTRPGARGAPVVPGQPQVLYDWRPFGGM